MNTTKILLGSALLVACACVVVSYLSNKPQPPTPSKAELQQNECERRVKHVLAPRKLPGEGTAVVARPSQDSVAPFFSAHLQDPDNPDNPFLSEVPQPVTGSTNSPWQDPDARVALSLVGADDEANLYWMRAINNPNLAAKERQDLIEDLNEEGFPDPKNVTADDLPLILSRMELIEELAPDAMDSVNADAFQEAYKDLVNMYLKVMSR